MSNPLQYLLLIGRARGGTLIDFTWGIANGGDWRKETGWVYPLPGPSTGTPFSQFWAQYIQDNTTFWFADLDIGSYAPDLAASAGSLVSRLEEFTSDANAEMDKYVAGPHPHPSEFPYTGPRHVLAFPLIRLGALACVASYPDAPPKRQEELKEILIEATKIAYDSEWRDVWSTLSLDEQPPVAQSGASGQKPMAVGFTPIQSARVEKAIGWIAKEVPSILPGRPVTITPVPPNTKTSGGTDVWSGNITLDSGIFSRADVDAELVQVISHELFHAMADSILDRLYSKIRSKGITGITGSKSLVVDESEEDFIEAAGLAVRAQFVGDDGPVIRRLVFENAAPILRRGDGDLRLPSWSPLVAAFALALTEDQLGPGVTWPGEIENF